MGSFSLRSSLYRTAELSATVLALAFILAQALPAQLTPKTKPRTGPRALALIQLSPNGKGHLVPIAILDGGRFFDASVYKATPVPMALEPGTVYEGFKTGVSQGLFTITGVLQGQRSWSGEGKWMPAGERTTSTVSKTQGPVTDDNEGPPVLRRADKTPPEPATPPPPVTSPPPAIPAPAPPPADATPEPAEDPNRPMLRRGGSKNDSKKPAAAPSDEKRTPTIPTEPAPAAVQWIPAISDASGPNPRAYTFDAKPEELADYRIKMLALATAELRRHLKDVSPAQPQPAPGRKSTRPVARSRPVQPAFSSDQLRIFDLTSSNEPVLVLSGQAEMPRSGTSAPPTLYSFTLVARTNLALDVRKVFYAQTDLAHLDLTPRLELIDAVDADGDGQGELLFRRITDAGSAYSIYRVTGDQLWPLFEGTP